MDLSTLYYFSELAKDLNMTRTAQRLFISQQTLSNHIARLEDYYGTKLFYRKPSLSLTPAGRAVLSYAETASLENERLKNPLSDILGQEDGTIRLGGNYTRLHAFLSQKLQLFLKRYPKVSVTLLDILPSASIESLLLRNEMDLGVVLYGKEHHRLLYQRVMTDEIFLCVSDRLLAEYYGDDAAGIRERSIARGVDLHDFDRLPFYLFDNIRGRQVDVCFEEAGVTPRVMVRGVYTENATRVCFQGMVACFLSRMNLLEQGVHIPADLGIYRILYRGKPLAQEIALVRNRDNYMPAFTQYLWNMMADFYRELGEVPLLTESSEEA